jgi:hypothetical protein
MLRADLPTDRALTGLVCGELLARDLPVVVVKRQLAWIAAQSVLAGMPPPGGAGGLPRRLVARLT